MRTILTLFSFLFAWNAFFAQEPKTTEVRLDSIAVLFDYNRFAILNEKLLENRLNEIGKPISRIVLMGYTDSLGSAEDNVVLASKRIRAVADFLRGTAWKNARVETQNMNETAGYPHPDLVQNRRVDILVFAEKEEEPLHVELGKPVNLNINFVGGQDVFLEESYPRLEQLLSALLKDSTLQVELLGHVCCADDYDLSVRRAFAVFSYLNKNGIAAVRMSAEGYSNSRRLVPDTSEKNMSLNRRVEAVFHRK